MQLERYLYHTDYEDLLPLYLTSVGLHYNETTMERSDGFISHQLILTVKGQGIFEAPNMPSTLLKEGDLLVLPAGIPHRYEKKTAFWHTHWISFRGNGIKAILSPLGFDTLTVIPLKNTLLFETVLKKIYSQTAVYSRQAAGEISSQLYKLFIDLNNQFISTTPHSKNCSNKLTQVLHYIDQHYATSLSLIELSELVHVSPQYLCGLFKKELNTRPMAYINELRINKSIDLLLNEQKTISEIASAVGFMHVSYYGLQFKKLQGLSPTAFISQHKR